MSRGQRLLAEPGALEAALPAPVLPCLQQNKAPSFHLCCSRWAARRSWQQGLTLLCCLQCHPLRAGGTELRTPALSPRDKRWSCRSAAGSLFSMCYLPSLTCFPLFGNNQLCKLSAALFSRVTECCLLPESERGACAEVLSRPGLVAP